MAQLTTAQLIDIVMPYVTFFAIILLGLFIVVVGVIIIIKMRQRKWRVELHEQKADGRLHTVGRDMLIERKIANGTKTVYWLRRAKSEAIPPPDECVDRFKNKEEVDYLRVERDYIPAKKVVKTNYNDPLVRKKLAEIYDKMIASVHNVKTTFFDSEPVRSRFLYIPIRKTLTANMEFKPIDYDMNMMAINEIHNADEFFASKYEFWKKYGAVIVFAMTIVFLIILIVLTFNYVSEVINTTLAGAKPVGDSLSKLTEILSGQKPI